jgi:phosphoribosylanthranilate isomerase
MNAGMTKIKNCGLKTPEVIDQAISTGASFIGFVHHEISPRHISITQMAKLITHTNNRAKTVAVLVSPSDALLHEVISAAPDYIQLHNVPNPARIQEISALTGKPIISAIAVQSAHDLALAATFEEISSHLLFDAAKAGSGHAFDWALLRNLPLKKPWFLAGGLTPDNIASAIRSTNAPMVDVSSGIEESLGNKSLEKIASFNAAVLNASHA